MVSDQIYILVSDQIIYSSMRSSLTRPYGDLQSCAVEATKSGAKDLFGSPLEGAAASAVEDSEFEPTIWVCLQCGHQVGLDSLAAC